MQKTNCIKKCILNQQKQFCIGCFRTIDEIKAWSYLSESQKNSILGKTQYTKNEKILDK